MYIPKSLQEENVHNNCLMGLIFWTNWGPDQQKSKHHFHMIFKKTFQKYRFLVVFLNQALVLHVLCPRTVTDLVVSESESESESESDPFLVL